LTDSGSVSETFAKLRSRWDSLDILVNNAGTTHLPMQMEDVTEEDFDKVFAVNAKSVFYTSKYGVPWMKKTGAGAIVNIASTAALSPRANLTWYNASKGWMVTATKSMAIELAPAGIRVNAICPVAGETPLLASFMGGDTPATREKFIASIPLGRLSTPEDIAATALYLSSDDAAMITGVALEVDGGRCI
jgi:3-oxoacyl-[acyl-carrier protein] reductase